MTTQNALTEINGQALSTEQHAYINGLFAGLRNRGVTFADIRPDPLAAPAQDAGDLTAEERVKRELHPLDAYPQLLEHAVQNKAPAKEDLFRFKWHGLFYLTPNKEAYMARLRIPGGQLKSFQLRAVAKAAEELTSGYVQITTRSNLQVRLIQPKDAPEFLARVQGVGLHTRGAGADNIRNLTANPTAGFDPEELIDTLPLCHQLGQIILNSREFYDLPRKFNIAFDGGGAVGSLEDTNDIGLTAVRVAQDHDGVAAGVWFRAALGGATGHKAFATDLGVLIHPTRVLEVVAALVRVFIKHGDRTNRKRARLKHLLESMPPAAYLEAAEKLLPSKLPRAPLDASGNSPLHSWPEPRERSHTHLGVHRQKQRGLNYIGAALPAGQITPRQLLRLADLADHYGVGEIRLTVWQNLILPGIPDAFVETVKRSLVSMGLDWRQSNLRGGLVACTGNSYCKFASANTKGHALELADYLDGRIKLDQPINIHLTGCPHSCAQHYIGDIGLLATQVKVDGEAREGYHLFVGGGFGANKAIGRQLFSSLTIEQLKPTLETILATYQRHRLPAETFQQFTTRHEVDQLKLLLA